MYFINIPLLRLSPREFPSNCTHCPSWDLPGSKLAAVKFTGSRPSRLVFFMCWSWYQLCKHFCVPLSLCLCSAKLSTMTMLLCYEFFLELHEHGIMACLERKKWQIPSWFKPLFFQLNSKFMMCCFYFYAPCNCLVLHRYDPGQWISFKGFSGTFLTNWLLTFCFI